MRVTVASPTCQDFICSRAIGSLFHEGLRAEARRRGEEVGAFGAISHAKAQRRQDVAFAAKPLSNFHGAASGEGMNWKRLRRRDLPLGVFAPLREKNLFLLSASPRLRANPFSCWRSRRLPRFRLIPRHALRRQGGGGE